MSLLEKPSIYNAQSVYNQGGGGIDIGVPSDTVRINGIEHKLIFFCGRIFTENLKYPVDLGTHTFYPNGNPDNLNDYGFLYDYTAVNALRANINNINIEWGKWAVVSESGVYSFENSSSLHNAYTSGEWIDAFKVQKAGLRINSNGTYSGFGSSMCLAMANTGSYYYDITNDHFYSYPVSNSSMSVRIALIKP